ncbi:MAG TPA: hypothetical protein VM324_11085 [Egibacteraceae bacterium]|nr:hypothetical protein [Egibacteraceae bacterium]
MVGLELLTAIALGGLHVFAWRLRFLDRVPRSRFLSAAGGISVAYVFVHLLPELAAAQEAVAERIGGPLRFLDAHIYLVALAGLVVFYALERQSVRSRERRRERHGVDETEDRVARLSFGSYAVYNAIIGYLLTDRADVASLLLFAAALGVHFAVVDHGLRAHHGRSYRAWGRWVCGSAVVLGWAVGAAFRVPEAVPAAVLAFLAGGVVMNVLKEELPEERESRLGPFVAGAGGYALLLLAL